MASSRPPRPTKTATANPIAALTYKGGNLALIESDPDAVGRVSDARGSEVSAVGEPLDRRVLLRAWVQSRYQWRTQGAHSHKIDR